jgi:light-regulated signal transduction histidine kinase (bacteriophytochrome)
MWSLSMVIWARITKPSGWALKSLRPVICWAHNLILNAVTFNRSAPKRIEPGWRPVETVQYELYVRDNGIGIDPRYQAQIFNVFQRLHTRQEYAGTGIGLAIVQEAVSKLQGTVRVESTPGEGSTFFVTLPRRSGGEGVTR